jgi:hypothetical protein
MASHTAPVTVRLKPPVRDRLRARAEQEGRKPADLARHLLERALDGKEATVAR